jgi:MFS family permease
MQRLKGSKMLIYAFFQILILAVARGIIAPLIPIISGELGVGLDYIGSAIALSIFALFFVSLTTGNLIEIMGLKKVLFIGLAVNFIGSVLLFFSHTFPMFIVAYFLMEIGVGMLMIGNLSIIGTFYSKSRTSSMIKMNYGNTAAFIISPLLVSLLLYVEINWRYYYLIHPTLLIILAIILWRMDIPRLVKIETSLKKLFAANKWIVSNPAFLLCGFIILLYVSVMNTFYVWFTSYFTSIDIGINISSLFLAIYGAAIFLGMVLRNKLIQYFKKKRLLFYSFIISIFLLAGVLLVDNLIIKNILIFLFGIGVAGNFSITFSIASGLFPKHTNSASGIMVAFANLGMMIFQYISGYMSEHFSRNSVLYINISLIVILIVLTTLLNFHRKFQRVV